MTTRKSSKENMKGGAEMMNESVREAARRKGLRHWQIAEALGISESVFSRRLRHELPEAEKQRICGIIDDIAKAREGECE